MQKEKKEKLLRVGEAGDRGDWGGRRKYWRNAKKQSEKETGHRRIPDRAEKVYH